MMTEKRYYATGRRKNAVARVYMKEGSGAILVNKRNLDYYFTRDSLKMLIRQPFEITGNKDKWKHCRPTPRAKIGTKRAEPESWHLPRLPKR